ncbi:helix-turn-helix domain-containing protein [Rheinheimera hassiensis]|uniref:helix-turn-helix domain-containing protein n=1 Tax=Rheinheimera hassiensis TaxID=1193627 RepID=UPI001F05653F|nr:helix-turn-helix transcriptional regulator [Rheinheimera hassiensis]
MNKHFLIALGKNIQYRRKQKQLTQLSLCHATGIDLSYISRIERGQVNMSVEALLKISDALDCELKALIPDTNLPQEPNTD